MIAPSVVFPIRLPALKVVQPIGVFYVTVLPAWLLLDVAYSDALSATLREGGVGYELTGTQRLRQPKRLQPIADFINRHDAAFPNSIILAANFRKEDGLIEDDESLDQEGDAEPSGHQRWIVEERSLDDNNLDENGEPGSCVLTIPSREKLASIIDGQHRLFGFAQAGVSLDRLNMNLICSVFMDLPRPYQAELFATINSNQKPVDKSLTYELFGYNINEESEAFWSPDKLAVFLTRKLGTEAGSPLKGRIVIAPRRDQALKELGDISGWKVSTAVVVEGIMRLITTNPKKDTTTLLAKEGRRRKDIAEFRSDKSPLRGAYLESQDAPLYLMTLNYLKACESVFWNNAQEDSFITKTVGVQALFDILRKISLEAFSGRDIRMSYFVERFASAGEIDFSIDKFRNASGSGRSAIRQAIEEKLQ